MAATIITTEDLQYFKQELLEEIRNLLGEKETTSDWMRSSDLRKLLKISPGTLQNLRINGTLPFTKVGGVIFYAKEDVLQMLEDHKSNSN